MGMTTAVLGFISPDNEEYQKHSRVLRACIDAGIKKLPNETAKYFDYDFPDEFLFEEKLEIKIPHHEFSADMQDGFEIIITEIPSGVHKIRFVNSY